MRALLWVTVVLAALWGGWWVVGSRGAEAAAAGWFADQAAQGREASYETLAVRGFPSRFDLTITAPRLADPVSGLGWRAPFAQVFAMSWKPWHLIAALPGGQVFATPEGDITLQAERMLGSLMMVPGPDLALSEAVVEGDTLGLEPAVAGVSGASRAVASIRAEGSRTNGYRLGLALRDLALMPALVEGTGLAPTVGEVQLDAIVALSAPLDRHAGDTRPALRLVDLREARVLWGDLKLHGKGEFAPDAAGFAAGRVDLRVENWRHLPPFLAAFGVITADFAPALERGLEVMATQGGDPSVLVVPLVAKDGRISLGPMPLGPAPYWGD